MNAACACGSSSNKYWIISSIFPSGAHIGVLFFQNSTLTREGFEVLLTSIYCGCVVAQDAKRLLPLLPPGYPRSWCGSVRRLPSWSSRTWHEYNYDLRSYRFAELRRRSNYVLLVNIFSLYITILEVDYRLDDWKIALILIVFKEDGYFWNDEHFVKGFCRNYPCIRGLRLILWTLVWTVPDDGHLLIERNLVSRLEIRNIVSTVFSFPTKGNGPMATYLRAKQVVNIMGVGTWKGWFKILSPDMLSPFIVTFLSHYHKSCIVFY